jgi:hypothetical protein
MSTPSTSRPSGPDPMSPKRMRRSHPALEAQPVSRVDVRHHAGTR